MLFALYSSLANYIQGCKKHKPIKNRNFWPKSEILVKNENLPKNEMLAKE